MILQGKSESQWDKIEKPTFVKNSDYMSDDKDGKPVLAVDEDLPIDIAAAAINKIGEILGKPQSKASTLTTGNQ